MPSVRQAKVAEMIRRELAEILQREMSDPRLALVSVTAVEVARDFTVAKVFVSVIGDMQVKADALKALQGASGFVRGQLGQRIELRTVPSLKFLYDSGVERGARMFELLREDEKDLAGKDLAGGDADDGADEATEAADEIETDEAEETGEEEGADDSHEEPRGA